jgi:cytoskeletal protein CcmA (bactofilin family)
MLLKKKAPPIRSLVGEGTVVQGDVSFTEGLRIDGEVHGHVTADGDTSMLVIGEKARVRGEVKAAHVIIAGEVIGPVHSTEMLELQPKARVIGAVHYEVLEMHPGALIDGEMRPFKLADKPTQEKPALVVLAAAKQG